MHNPRAAEDMRERRIAAAEAVAEEAIAFYGRLRSSTFILDDEPTDWQIDHDAALALTIAWLQCRTDIG